MRAQKIPKRYLGYITEQRAHPYCFFLVVVHFMYTLYLRVLCACVCVFWCVLVIKVQLWLCLSACHRRCLAICSII